MLIGYIQILCILYEGHKHPWILVYLDEGSPETILSQIAKGWLYVQFPKKLPNYLPNGCITLHSHQQWIRAPVASHPCQH